MFEGEASFFLVSYRRERQRVVEGRGEQELLITHNNRTRGEASLFTSLVQSGKGSGVSEEKDQLKNESIVSALPCSMA